MKQAVILAGGKGTRLRDRLAGRPKPLVDVDGVPLLAWQLRFLHDAGIERVVLLVNHEAAQIVDYCCARGNFGLEIEFVDDGEPRGTAGAVIAVLDRLDDTFAVVYGDTMLHVDLDRMYRFHAARRPLAATLFLHPNDHPHDSDLVEIDDDGRVAALHPYPHPPGSEFPNLVNAALYIVERDALLRWADAPAPLDFAKDLFPRMLRAGQALAGYVSPEYIKDAGTPERLDRVVHDLRRGRIAQASLAVARPAVFIDRDGTLNPDPGHIRTPDDLVPFPGIGRALKRLNDAGLRTVLVTNQPVVARGECTPEMLRRIHARLEWRVAEDKALFDRIYYCPHHPDAGFAGEVAALKIPCDCRKPAPGMLLRARDELNLDLASSWLIGDSTSDAGAASRAGVTSVIVETGAAGLDDKYPYTADFTARDFADAVDFIVARYPALARCVESYASAAPGSAFFIGGLSRAGKSSFASALAREIRRRGGAAAVIRLDRWLLGAERRGNDVFGRYDLDELGRIATRLLDGRGRPQTIDVPFYSRRTKTRLPVPERLEIPAGAVMIFEGVVAVELARRLGRLADAIDIRADEAARRERVLREYRVRGLSRDAAEAVYESRHADEHVPVTELGLRAARYVSIDAVFADAAETTKAPLA